MGASRPLTRLALAAAVAGATLLPAAPALAHRDGCHRWHSCPSDSGSYVCGDLGYDSECPSTTTYEPPPPRDTTPPATPTLHGTTVEGSRVTFEVTAEKGASIRVYEGDSRLTSVTATGGAQSVSVRLADGAHALTILARDAAGNESAARRTSVTVDATAPDAAEVTVGQATPEAPWTVVEVVGEPGSSAKVTVDGSADSPAADLPATGSIEIPLLLVNGEHEIAVTLADDAGNVSAPAVRTIDVQVQAPAPPRLTLTSAPGAAAVRLAVDGVPLGTVDVSGVGTARVDLDEDGIGVVDMTLDDGEHRLRATTTDHQGQISRAATIDVVVDTVAPEIDLAIDAAALAKGTIAWAVTGEPGTEVVVSVAEEGYHGTLDGPLDGEAAVEAGEYVVTVVATDPFGNQTRQSQTVEVTIPLTLAAVATGAGILAALVAGVIAGVVTVVRRLTRRRVRPTP